MGYNIEKIGHQCSKKSAYVCIYTCCIVVKIRQLCTCTRDMSCMHVREKERQWERGREEEGLKHREVRGLQYVNNGGKKCNYPKLEDGGGSGHETLR